MGGADALMFGYFLILFRVMLGLKVANQENEV